MSTKLVNGVNYAKLLLKTCCGSGSGFITHTLSGLAGADVDIVILYTLLLVVEGCIPHAKANLLLASRPH